MKIYTKTGDAGETSLFDQARVSKADPRVDAYGEVDEVNACLGAARAALAGGDIAEALEAIQKDLFALGARLADPATRIAGRVTKAAITEFMRQLPYRLLCTATAAPNDYIELGTSSEALGIIGYVDMLGMFFKNDESSISPMSSATVV